MTVKSLNDIQYEDLRVPAALPVVHLVCKSHLDVGFTDSAAVVVHTYFTQHIPQAMAVAAELRAREGQERLVWTVGSWLLYEYLEQATTRQRQALEHAIHDGDLTWHALPFTTHTELLDPALFRFGLSLSETLDRRFGRQTIAAKMTDVPGHTRAMIPDLVDAGIRFLHIGVNPVCRPPQVPPMFRWRSPSGTEVVVMYQNGSYGGVQACPGSDAVLAFAHQGDNAGPPTTEAVLAAHARLREAFPGHRVVASTMDAFAQDALAAADHLPVVTDEIGDTWIHGVGTDPHKVAAFRAWCRLRTAWERDERVSWDDPAYAAASRALLLIGEHTWGKDEKTHLPADGPLPAGQLFHKEPTYAPAAFQAIRHTPKFSAFAESWAEQRAYLDTARAAIAPRPDLCAEVDATLAALMPVRPCLDAYQPLDDWTTVMETPHFTVGLDAITGAITTLVCRASDVTVADAMHPLGLIRYQTFAATDYARFVKEYLINLDVEFAPGWCNADWAQWDFTKPGIDQAGARTALVEPRLTWVGTREDHHAVDMLAAVTFPSWCVTDAGAPREIWLTYTFPHATPTVEIMVQWFGKPACRLPEALWCSFIPCVSEPACWEMDKMGEWISPSDVICGGNRLLHAVQSGVRCPVRTGHLLLETLDAPLVAPGAPQLLRHNNDDPNDTGGMHINLYNNVWGTNFPMWYADDARFRFALRLT
jgi:hypothetical protein